MKWWLLSSYKGALALDCLPVRKNWRNIKVNSGSLIAGCVCHWPFTIQTLFWLLHDVIIYENRSHCISVSKVKMAASFSFLPYNWKCVYSVYRMVPTSLQKRPWPFTPPLCTGWRVGASHQSRSPHCLTNMTPSCSSWRWRGSKKHTGKQAENIAFNFSDAYFLTSGSRIARVCFAYY